MKPQVAIIFGGKSAEYEASLRSAQSVTECTFEACCSLSVHLSTKECISPPQKNRHSSTFSKVNVERE